MAAATLLVLTGAYAAGSRAARRSAQLDAARKSIKAQKEARRVEQEIDALDDDAVRRRARRWVRDQRR
ncbi:MAG: hypothetical protein ACK5JE_08020 [Castellaniella sp.]|uniref:hypothetical protein n=1 Tax=Castellaniella sp. TaxID=1955812 RepID=UPI003A890BA6